MRRAICVVTLAFLTACSGDDGGGGGPVTHKDAGSDAKNDAHPDAKADANDAGPDAAPDASDDGNNGSDAASDAAENDAPADAPSEADAPDPLDGFSAAEWAIINSLSPLPALPADTTNQFADDTNAAALGQMLFFDKSYSGAIVTGDDGTNGGLGAAGETGKIACASCHLGTGLDDQRSNPNNVSLGADWLGRNALPLVNSSFYSWVNWAGRFDSQWSLPLGVVENAKNMHSTRLDVAHLLWNKYKTEYDAIFPVPLDPDLDPASANASRFPTSGKPGDASWTGMAAADQTIVNRIFANYGKAIQAYLRLLVSRNGAFDKYVAGDHGAISEAAKRGLRLFINPVSAGDAGGAAGGGCINCHSGPSFSDNAFHALLVPQTGTHVPATDLGRNTDVPPLLASPFNSNGLYSDDTNTGRLTGLVQTDAQKNQFRTKGLRGVAASAPYMHAGQLATLDDVITFYAAGGGDPGDSGLTKDPQLQPLTLQNTDAADLVEFLKTLDGEPIPAALLVDTSK